MSDLPVLYSFRRCPYAMRARMALAVSGTRCAIREVALSRKPPDLALASPKATVPVLVLPDGKVIDESLDIMRWALAQDDPEGWLARHDPALIEANDGAFKHHLDRYKYPDRHGSDPLSHRDAALGVVASLEHRLSQHANLHDDSLGLTDVAIFPFVRQFSRVDPGWFAAQPLPSLQRWLAAHTASELFEGVMLRLPPWQAGDPVTPFPLA